jgi:hypothetical protein
MKKDRYVTHRDIPLGRWNVFRVDAKGEEHFILPQGNQDDAQEFCDNMNNCKCCEFEGDNDDCPLHGKAGQ